MPELPEVEVVRLGIEQILQKQNQIDSFEFRRPDLRDPMPIKKLKEFSGQKITAIERRAKYLLFQTEKGTILSHLGMSGSWRFEKKRPDNIDLRTHDHVLVHMAGGSVLIYNDPRRFGIFECFKRGEASKRLAELAPEPLSTDFNENYLKKALAGSVSPIKAAIMDQKKVVGVGNIYASEVLFRCGIKPTRAAKSIKLPELTLIVQHTKEVLSEAIAAGGSSIHSFVKADGESGDFQTRHFVYGRAGEKCRECDTEIRSKVIGNRSSFWCPNCQK